MEIKKSTVVGIAFIFCVATGLLLIQILFESLPKYGWAGYASLIIFLASLFWIIFDLRRQKSGYKIIEETVEEVASEYESKLSIPELENYKVQLRDYLKKDLEKETYKITGRRKNADRKNDQSPEQPKNIHVNIKEHYPLKARTKRFFHKFLP